MDNALLVGLSRQMALGHEFDVVANNIANVNTTGYKADNAAFAQYLMPGASDNDFTGTDQRIAFVQDRASWIDLGAGSIDHTGNPLDIAIDGKGYLVVQTPRGRRYTRDGTLSINANGTLVTGDGSPVLGTGGTIAFQPTDHDVSISPSGMITVRSSNGTASVQRGQLQLVVFDRPQSLRKDGGSTFAAPASVNANPAPPSTRVVQGALEKSNVRAVVEMARMIEISRNFSDISDLLQQEGDLQRTALKQLAQTPT